MYIMDYKRPIVAYERFYPTSSQDLIHYRLLNIGRRTNRIRLTEW
jgi:hypothetical protein